MPPKLCCARQSNVNDSPARVVSLAAADDIDCCSSTILQYMQCTRLHAEFAGCALFSERRQRTCPIVVVQWTTTTTTSDWMSISINTALLSCARRTRYILLDTNDDITLADELCASTYVCRNSHTILSTIRTCECLLVNVPHIKQHVNHLQT